MNRHRPHASISHAAERQAARAAQEAEEAVRAREARSRKVIVRVPAATEKVQLLKPGVLIGDVRTPSFTMEEGAHFHGLCDMGTDVWGTDDRQESDKVHDLAAHRGKVRLQDLPS